MKTDIMSMTVAELSDFLVTIGERSFRAKQVFEWLRRGTGSFSEMTNLSVKLRSALESRFYITMPQIVSKRVSEIDGTIKYLLKMHDGQAVEAVFMQYSHGNTACISTQAGCRMGCAFCASTLGGLVRNLTPSEMEAQVTFIIRDTALRISNIVLMGIGEPLDNFDNVIRFLELANNSSGLGIGMRHITLSTCGIVEKIDKLGDYNLQLTLSVSLHAPDDETRNRIMPVNASVGVDALLETCQNYFKKTGRRVTYEYAMIDGVNDTEQHARLLADKLSGTGSHVNLILLNSVPERGMKQSKPGSVKVFKDCLAEKGINYTVRRRLGADIDAACGQLRRKI